MSFSAASHVFKAATWAVVGVLCVLIRPVNAMSQTASSPDVKAAFVLNFTRFVAWPTAELGAGRPIVIGVAGNNAVADSLSNLARGKTIDGHAVWIQRLADEDDPAGMHLLFIGDGGRDRMADLLTRAGSKGVLTVSDVPRFCLSGGMIQLRIEDDRIRFDINLDRAELSGLAVSSKLLALAGSVTPPKHD